MPYVENDKIISTLIYALGASEEQAQGLASWVFDDFVNGDEEKLALFLRERDARLYRNHDEYQRNEDPDDRDTTNVDEDASYGVIVWNI